TVLREVWYTTSSPSAAGAVTRVLRRVRASALGRTVDPCGQLPGKDPGDALERTANVAREQGDRPDHGDRDHGEDDAVLRHRLPFFAPAQRVCSDLREDEELQHLIS